MRNFEYNRDFRQVLDFENWVDNFIFTTLNKTTSVTRKSTLGVTFGLGAIGAGSTVSSNFGKKQKKSSFLVGSIFPILKEMASLRTKIGLFFRKDHWSGKK